jgi:hypothetical protein
MSEVGVAGSRAIKNRGLVAEAIDEAPFNPSLIIHTDTDGVGTAAGMYAAIEGIDTQVVQSQHHRYPQKLAPVKRKNTIVEEAQKVIIIWEGESTSTQSAMDTAKRRGMRETKSYEKHELEVYYYE